MMYNESPLELRSDHHPGLILFVFGVILGGTAVMLLW